MIKTFLAFTVLTLYLSAAVSVCSPRPSNKQCNISLYRDAGSPSTSVALNALNPAFSENGSVQEIVFGENCKCLLSLFSELDQSRISAVVGISSPRSIMATAMNPGHKSYSIVCTF